MPSKFMLAYRGDLGVLQRSDMVGETKLDGTRCHIRKTPAGLELWSRNSKDNTYSVNYAEVHNLPEVEHDVRNLDCKSVWLDVELVWFNKFGRSIMRGSQVRCGTRRFDAVLENMKLYPITACAFDLLELNGWELIKEPLMVRKAMLKGFLADEKNLHSLRYLDYTFDKQQLWEHMLGIGGEGIMAKTLTGTYEFRRSREWLKLKNESVTDGKKGRPPPLNVVGYTLGQGKRSPYFASLVLMNDEGEYVCNVGNGFNRAQLEWWTQQLHRAKLTSKPFPDSVVGERYIAVEIPFKVKVRYYEETTSGALRFPVYVGYVK